MLGLGSYIVITDVCMAIPHPAYFIIAPSLPKHGALAYMKTISPPFQEANYRGMGRS